MSDTISRQNVDLGYTDENPDPWPNDPRRVMTAAEIKERGDLNVANTASALRARVVAALANRNGH